VALIPPLTRHAVQSPLGATLWLNPGRVPKQAALTDTDTSKRAPPDVDSPLVGAFPERW